MNADLSIRKMLRTDLSAVTVIDQRLFGKERFPTWPFSFEVYWREYSPDISLVADTGDRLAGFIVGCVVVEEHSRSVLNLRRSEKPRPVSRVGWIDMIGVLPDSQHSGVGRRLVESFCSECESMGIPVRAVTTEHDARLRRFLDSIGFKVREFMIYERNP